MREKEEVKKEKGTFIYTLVWSIIRVTEIIMER
jgi:hypothetical protein